MARRVYGKADAVDALWRANRDVVPQAGGPALAGHDAPYTIQRGAMKACDHGPDPAGNRHATNRVRPLFGSLSGRNVERRKDLSMGKRRWRVLTLTQAIRDIPELSASTGRAELLKTVPLLMMVVATGHFNRVGMAVAGTDRIVKVYGVDPERMGLVYSAFLLVYTLAMLPGGWFIDRFGPRVALMVLCFGSTVFVALTGAVGLVAEGPCALWLGLLVVRSLLGLVNAPLHPASARMVFEHVPPASRSMANGLVTFAACVGIAATFYVLGALIDRFDWPIAFLISGGLTLIVAMVWTLGTRPSRRSVGLRRRPGAARFELAALWPVLRRRSVVCVTLSYVALRLLPVPVLLLDPVLLRDQAEGRAGRGAGVLHDDHPGDGDRHARRWVAGRSRPAIALTPRAEGAGARRWG